MRRRHSFMLVLVLAATGLASVRVAAASAAPSASPTYVKTYANFLNKVQYDVTPESVEPTSDGGEIVLAATQAPQSLNGTLENWLVKLDSSGNPQWQRELGCFGLPPGDNSIGLSIQQTADGGYIVGGGTLGCGSQGNCPPLSGLQCALVEKLDSRGTPVWAFAYLAGSSGSVVNQIRQAADGGYIAVGSSTDNSQNTGAVILKLDGRGTVQWQRQIGPAASTQTYFNAVQQTADGGYVTAGELYGPVASVLAVKFDASGNMQWQRGFNKTDSHGSPVSTARAFSVVQASDGGYLVAGIWFSGSSPGQCCSGALLLKLDAAGHVRWQKAYGGGVYCYFNGFNETCKTIGAVIYSAHRTADGGYLLAGSGDLELTDSVPLVPWMAKVDANGKLLWQQFDFQIYPPTGRPLSEYFASSSLSKQGSPTAVGWTENYTAGKGELYAAKTTATGNAGACSDVRAATPLKALNPALTTLAPSLPVGTTVAPAASSPVTTMTTSIVVGNDC